MKKSDNRASGIVVIFGKGYDERRLRSYLSNGDARLAHKHAMIIIAGILKSCVEKKETLPFTSTTLEMSLRGSIPNVVLAIKPYGFKGNMSSLCVYSKEVGYPVFSDLILDSLTCPKF